MDFECNASNKKPDCQHRRCKGRRFDPWIGKIPWRRAWQPTPVFLPGESQGQRSRVDKQLLKLCSSQPNLIQPHSKIPFQIWLLWEWVICPYIKKSQTHMQLWNGAKGAVLSERPGKSSLEMWLLWLLC